jgi:hypothetical protein
MNVELNNHDAQQSQQDDDLAPYLLCSVVVESNVTSLKKPAISRVLHLNK